MEEFEPLFRLDVDRPWLRSTFVSTIDGAAYAPDHLTGQLGGPADASVFRLMRSLADVIVVGANTTRMEQYAAIVESELNLEARERAGLSGIPPIAVVSTSLDIPSGLDVPSTLVFTNESGARRSTLSHAEVIECGTDQVDVHALVSVLADRGLWRINVEGGPSLHGQLLDADLIDEICLTLDPSLHGGPASRIAHSATAHPRAMSLAHCTSYGDTVLLRYVRTRGLAN